MSFNLIEFLEQCFRAVVWSSSEFEETLCKIAGCCCASIWFCSAVYCNAAPQTQVVLVGVQRQHRPTMRKVTQPVWQGACAQQWLTVEHDPYINIRITPKYPFCVWPFDVINVQAPLLLFSQPIFCSIHHICLSEVSLLGVYRTGKLSRLRCFPTNKNSYSASRLLF